jgi:hypothetical protein
MIGLGPGALCVMNAGTDSHERFAFLPFTEIMNLRSALSLVFCAVLGTATAAPVRLVDQPPEKVTRPAPGRILVDFGRVAFGNFRVTAPAGASGRVVVHFGEAFSQGAINRKPPGTVRYSRVEVELRGGQPVLVAPPVDKRNTEVDSKSHPPAILTPAEWGVVTPFRWVEIEGWPEGVEPGGFVRQAAFASTWDDGAADFRSSDEMLNRVWDLCRYSIKATTFAGVYVDGDRERIPYEADAYLNQLSHYTTDNDVQMARDTFDHLMKHGTWPTEWAPHMVFMAHADWWHTGDTKWLAPRYDSLKAKLLMDRVRPDGLVKSEPQHVKKEDIVDWPAGERDGYVFTPLNTVVNAFHLRALTMMAEMGRALGRDKEAGEFAAREDRSRKVFNERFFDGKRGIYRDGAETDHASLHANLFPLAFGLVPQERRPAIADWLVKRGMKCSVYPAQYLMDALFENGRGAEALDLMIAPGDRSWRHMVESGTTITWEAWDQKYKPNQDWNHAWGAAPANLLPRHVLGLVPGWSKTVISPVPGKLKFAAGKVPTPRGPVLVDWKNEGAFKVDLDVPAGIRAKVELPAAAGTKGVFAGGAAVPAKLESGRWILDGEVTGKVSFEVK